MRVHKYPWPYLPIWLICAAAAYWSRGKAQPIIELQRPLERNGPDWSRLEVAIQNYAAVTQAAFVTACLTLVIFLGHSLIRLMSRKPARRNV